MTRTRNYEKRVIAIEPGEDGWIDVVLACGHRVNLQPSPGETSEQKATRLSDAIGSLWLCEACHRLSHRIG